LDITSTKISLVIIVHYTKYVAQLLHFEIQKIRTYWKEWTFPVCRKRNRCSC